MEFIHHLVNTPSPEAKRAILTSAICASMDDATVELPDVVLDAYHSSGDFCRLCESVEREQYCQSDEEDTDPGPYQVWCTILNM